MSKSFQGCLLLSLVVVISLPGIAKTSLNDQGLPSLQMTVRVYNYAEVSLRALAQAQKEAGQIFGQIGIEMLWRDRSLCLARPQLQECQGSVGPSDLVLRILPKSMAQRQASRDTTLGMAVPTFQAYIFNDRVEKQAQLAGVPWERMLGVAIAHEIGHLLLGSNSHALVGIMRAMWRREELQRADREWLFLSDQAARIRAEVLRRIRQQEAIQVPRLNSANNSNFKRSVNQVASFIMNPAVATLQVCAGQG